MATVYRARDRRLGREVAVKVIHHHLRENKEVAARFVSEARAVAKVKHPNIVEVYDVSDADESERYLVQELVRGTTLRQLLSDQGYLPAEIAAAIAVEIAAALEHAHGLGVIHRDMKPENVLLDLPTEGQTEPEAALAPRVKITDFGIAKLLDVQGGDLYRSGARFPGAHGSRANRRRGRERQRRRVRLGCAAVRSVRRQAALRR